MKTSILYLLVNCKYLLSSLCEFAINAFFPNCSKKICDFDGFNITGNWILCEMFLLFFDFETNIVLGKGILFSSKDL